MQASLLLLLIHANCLGKYITFGICLDFPSYYSFLKRIFHRLYAYMGYFLRNHKRRPILSDGDAKLHEGRGLSALLMPKSQSLGDYQAHSKHLHIFVE